jgi:hypothetical protein
MMWLSPGLADGQPVQTELLAWAQAPLYQSGITGSSLSWIRWSCEVILRMPARSSVGVLSSCWTRLQARLFS